MAINSDDGEYALDCWQDPEADEPTMTVYSDSLDELKAHVVQLLESGVYRYAEISRWSDAADDWEDVEAYEGED